jgi:membrane-bound lytic murein transglycosylase D
VASRLNTDAEQIRDVNKIPKGMKIRSGSTIIIPRNETHKGDVPIELAQNPSLSLEREFVPVPVVMKCKGKKCVAVPSNLANYNSKDNAKVMGASNQSKTSSSKEVSRKSLSKSAKSSRSNRTANHKTQSKSSTTKKSNSK